MPIKPNLLLITCHDLGWSDLACYGNEFHRSPNLDRLADEGMRFTRAYAAAPICNPSRYAILTGRHPAREGLTGQPGYLNDPPTRRLLHPPFATAFPAETRVYAHALGDAGYDCAFSGVIGPKLDGRTMEDLGFAYLESKGDEDQARVAADFLAARPNRPFCLQVNFQQVHIPLQPPPEAATRWKARAAQARSSSNPIYAAVVESLDRAVGRVLQALDRSGLAQHTLVVFASDHGGYLGTDDEPMSDNSPLREGKASLYEGGTRIPMIFCWPGRVAQGATTDVPVHQCDLAPTFLAAAGIPPESIPCVDGRDLTSWLASGKELNPRPFFWHWPHYRRSMPGPGAAPSSAILDGEWKLIEFYEDGRLELYHLDGDSGESNDLAAAEPEIRRKLHAQLIEWREDVGARVGSPNPNFNPKTVSKNS